MDKSQENFDVIISGAGLTGQTCALSLADFGLNVLVIDSDTRESVVSATYDGRASAIALASYNLLSALGLGGLFEKHGSPILDIRVVDGHPIFGISPFFVHYSHKDLPEMQDKPFGYIVENRLLRQALQEKSENHKNIKILYSNRIISTECDGGLRNIKLRNGESFTTSLLIGAEGRFSATRAMLNIGTEQKKYDQASIVCTVTHECGHAGTAVELFYPSGPFAMLPMTGNRSNVVWTEKRKSAEKFMALDDEDFLEALVFRFGDWLGDIKLVGNRFSYPLSLLHAHQYTRPRFALIGDSAHAIHPIAGQGVNLGFRDCAAMAETIAESHRLGLDIGGDSVLKDYENWRRFDNQLLISVTDGLVHLFSNDNLLIKTARNAGFVAVQNMPVVKGLLQKHAMGMLEIPFLQMPRLLKGEAL